MPGPAREWVTFDDPKEEGRRWQIDVKAGADARFRYAVVKALSEIEDRRGDKTLYVARDDRDPVIRQAATEALKERHDDDHDDD